jgi:hypothetical protein
LSPNEVKAPVPCVGDGLAANKPANFYHYLPLEDAYLSERCPYLFCLSILRYPDLVQCPNAGDDVI